MSSIQYVTSETLNKMNQELSELKTSGRSNIAKAISEAREKGDLKENAEYDAAKEAQGMLEAKIAELESAISNARVVDKSKIDASRVSILTKVTITNIKMKQSFTYQIVSDSEANFKEKKLSISSPIAKGILGKTIGDIVEIETPNGIIEIQIDNITI